MHVLTTLHHDTDISHLMKDASRLLGGLPSARSCHRQEVSATLAVLRQGRATT